MTSLFSHRHGGAGYHPDMLDFSVSISPLHPFDAAPGIGTESIRTYPSIDGSGIREFYCRRYGLEKDTVLALNGAIEGIYLLPRAIPLRRMLLFAPSFHDYMRAARITGVETGFVRLDVSTGFAFPAYEELAEILSGYDALFACTPNNPTGTLLSPELIMALASRFQEKWFFVDEAFLQFLPGFEELTLMKHVGAFRNIVVVHSLTKFYSMPGLRLGALVGHPDTIRKLYDFKEPWTVNAIAENAARELAGCTAYEESLYLLIADERKRITDAFYPMKSMRIAGGSANFFLVQWFGKGSFDSLLVSLQGKGIIVRDCRNFDGLEGNYFRFSVRTTEENRILLDALRICDALQTVDRK